MRDQGLSDHWLTGPPPAHRGRAGVGVVVLRAVGTVFLLGVIGAQVQGNPMFVAPHDVIRTVVNLVLDVLLIVVPFVAASRIARAHRQEWQRWLAAEANAEDARLRSGGPTS